MSWEDYTITGPGGNSTPWFSSGRERVFLSPQSASQLSLVRSANVDQTASLATRQDIQEQVVRVPALQEHKWKVRVLQRWTGRVQIVGSKTFVAELTDTMHLANPLEEVELDLGEVSPGDLPLLEEGAIFYWSIGYRDSEGGQRSRVSTLRFARLPALTKSAVARAYDEADLIASFLDSE